MGRATRLCPDIQKTHFEIYDPVGTYDSLEDVNTMKPVVANPSASFSQLLDGLSVMEEEAKVQNQIDQIIAKLRRKMRNMDSKVLEHFVSMTGGQDPAKFVADLLQSPPQEGKERLLSSSELFSFLDQNESGGGRKVVISEAPDEVVSHTRGYGNGLRPEDYLDAFADYVKSNLNEIAALNIICTRPKDLTRESLKNLLLTLAREGFTPRKLNTAVSQMTNEEIAADIISLIRRYAIGSTLHSHEVRIRRAVDKLKQAHSFTKPELIWIGRMEKYLLEESVLNVDVFDKDGRFREQGGFAKIDNYKRANL